MKEQLIRYIDLLFAGAPQANDIKQEILQNTLDRYDDLISQGKSPEAAYRLAISGIGDINEILGETPKMQKPYQPQTPPSVQEEKEPSSFHKKLMRACAVALYILCPIPLFVSSDEQGLCGLLFFVAVATVLMILSGKGAANAAPPAENRMTPQYELRRSVKSIIWTVGLCAYFVLSFATHAWYITWLIFPITGAVQGLVIACMDLKEAN